MAVAGEDKIYLLPRVPSQVERPMGRLCPLQLGKLDIHETLQVVAGGGREQPASGQMTLLPISSLQRRLSTPRP